MENYIKNLVGFLVGLLDGFHIGMCVGHLAVSLVSSDGMHHRRLSKIVK